MNGPRRDSRRAGSSRADSPEESPAVLARTLRAQARAAATTALRNGLEQLEDAHGQHVADEVAGLLEVEEIFAGLHDPDRRTGSGAGGADDEPWVLKPLRP